MTPESEPGLPPPTASIPPPDPHGCSLLSIWILTTIGAAGFFFIGQPVLVIIWCGVGGFMMAHTLHHQLWAIILMTVLYGFGIAVLTYGLLVASCNFLMRGL